MADYFDRIEAHLMDAVVRNAGLRRSAHRLRGSRLGRRAPRGLALLGALVVLGGGAAAAVSLSERASAPLAGTVPSGRFSGGLRFSEAGKSYRVVVAPTLIAGEAGWYSIPSIRERGRFFAVDSLVLDGQYPSRSTPVVPGQLDSQYGRGAHGDVVFSVLSGPNVAAIRVAGQTIRTRRQSGLPGADRIAVFFLSTHHGYVGGEKVVALNAAGKVMAAAPSTEGTIGPQILTWHRAGGRPPSLGSNATHPPPGACELGQAGLPGLAANWGQVVQAVQAAQGAEGEVLASCVNAEYSYQHWPLEVAVLLNARVPGQVPGGIPGAAPVRGDPGTFNAVLGGAPSGLSARRVGDTWLVVEGGRNLAQRLVVLRALRVTKVDLSPWHPSISARVSIRIQACLNAAHLRVLAGPLAPYVLNVVASRSDNAQIAVYDTAAQDAADLARQRAIVSESNHSLAEDRTGGKSTAAPHLSLERMRAGQVTVTWLQTSTGAFRRTVARCVR